MASVTLLRNLIKKYRIGSKTAPASAKEPIAKANTKHAAFPEFKNQDSDDEKPLQFSRTKANVVGPSQSASKHKGFPKYKGWDSDDEEPLQIPRVKHVTAPPQHHHTKTARRGERDRQPQKQQPNKPHHPPQQPTNTNKPKNQPTHNHTHNQHHTNHTPNQTKTTTNHYNSQPQPSCKLTNDSSHSTPSATSSARPGRCIGISALDLYARCASPLSA